MSRHEDDTIELDRNPEQRFAAQMHCVADRRLREICESEAGFDLFRSLDNELMLLHGDRHYRLVLASATAREGRSTVGLLVASYSAAYAPDLRTLYIDASTDAGHLPQSLQCAPNQPGLYDYLAGHTPLADCIHQAGALSVIRGGSTTPGRKLFTSDRFREAMVELHTQYQRIIIDAPALETHRETLGIIQVVSSVLLIIRSRRTPRHRIDIALRDIKAVGGNVLGTVLTHRVFPLALGGRRHR